MSKGDRRARRAETVVNIYDRRAQRTETVVNTYDRRARRAETVVNIYDRRARRAETLVLCEIVDNGKSSTCPFSLFDSVRKHVGFLRTDSGTPFKRQLDLSAARLRSQVVRLRGEPSQCSPRSSTLSRGSWISRPRASGLRSRGCVVNPANVHHGGLVKICLGTVVNPANVHHAGR